MNSSSLISSVEDVLQQGRALLARVDDEAYTRKEEWATGSSLGAHYRHVLDHFLCLLEGIETEINYDHRRRSPALENSVTAAIAATDRLLQSFRALPADIWHGQCNVVYSVGYGNAETESVPSNLAREVMFCVGHAIHHFAIVQAAVRGHVRCSALRIR